MRASGGESVLAVGGAAAAPAWREAGGPPNSACSAGKAVQGLLSSWQACRAAAWAIHSLTRPQLPFFWRWCCFQRDNDAHDGVQLHLEVVGGPNTSGGSRLGRAAAARSSHLAHCPDDAAYTVSHTLDALTCWSLCQSGSITAAAAVASMPLGSASCTTPPPPPP